MSRNLNIKVNGRWLDVPMGTKMKIKHVNNIFYDVKPRRSFSFTVALKYTSRNNSILGWLFELGTLNSSVARINAELYDGNNFVHRIILEVSRTDGAYRCNAQFDYSTIDVLGSEVNIRNVPAFSDPANDMQGLVNAGAYPATTYAGIFGCVFRMGYPLDERRMMLNYGQDLIFPYLFYILKEVMKFCGWRGDDMTGSFMTDAELQTLHFFNFNEATIDFTGLASISPIATRLPDMTISDLVESVCTLFNSYTFFDNRTGSVRWELLKDILGNTPVNWSAKVPKASIERNWGTNVLSGITFKWPDSYYSAYERADTGSYLDTGWTDNDTALWVAGATDELLRVRTENSAFVWKQPEWLPGSPDAWWCVDYLGNIVKVDPSLIAGSAVDVGALPSPAAYTDQLYLVENENWYYRSDGGDWNRFTQNNHSLALGDGKRVITSKIAPVMVDRIGDELENANLRMTPVIKWFGNALHVADGHSKKEMSEMPPMLSFHRGIGYDSQNIPYYVGNSHPDRMSDFSSPDIYDAQGTQRGNYRMAWDTDNGLYNTFHKPWYEYVEGGQEVTIMANLTLLDIVDLDLSRPIHVHGAVGFIREIEYELPLTAPVKVTFVKKA